MKTFEKNAPELVCAITPKDGKEELVKFDCQKMKMQTGSFGYSGANKRINLEIEIDGEKQLVQAQVGRPSSFVSYAQYRFASFCAFTGHTQYHHHGEQKGGGGRSLDV